MTHTRSYTAESLLALEALHAELVRAAEAVLAAWERGDLAGAVRRLDQAVTNAKAGAP